MTGSPHPKRNFARHYVEMVVVMVGGMVVLGAPAGWLMGAFGTSWSQLSPAMMVLVMAVTMTPTDTIMEDMAAIMVITTMSR